MGQLTREQQDKIMAHLEASAYATLARINAETGWWHNLVSDDDGGGGRTECNTVLQDTLPVLQRTADRDRRSGDTDRWLGTALEAEQELKDVEGYVANDSIAQILKNTATASGQDLRDAADAAAKKVAAAVPWYVYLGGAAVLFLYVGGPGLLRKR